MFSIGQHVIHPGQGVCTVVGFRDDTPQPMLLLETKQGHAQTILMYPVAQADRHVDGVSAGKAVGGKAAIFGDDPNAAQFFASSCHTLSKSDICQQ